MSSGVEPSLISLIRRRFEREKGELETSGKTETQALTYEIYVRVLNDPRLKDVSEKSAPARVNKAVIEGAKGAANKVAQVVAEAVCGSKVFGNATPQQEPSARGLGLLARLRAVTNKLMDKILRLLNVQNLYLRGKLKNYALAALNDALKARVFIPTGFVKTFGENFDRRIQHDLDADRYKELFDKFKTEFCAVLENNKEMLQEVWRRVQPQIQN
jgi:hypothetical protein